MEGRAASWELFFADADKEAAVLPGSTLARLDADIPDSSVEAGGSTGPSKRRSNPAGWISDPRFNEIISGIAKIARGAHLASLLQEPSLCRSEVSRRSLPGWTRGMR
jgi:hypothetical protein